MSRKSKSSRRNKPRPNRRRAAKRFFRPAGEPLESRRLLASDSFGVAMDHSLLHGFEPTILVSADIDLAAATEASPLASSPFSGVVSLSIRGNVASGVLVSDYHIVTAAHNFDLESGANDVTKLGNGTIDVSPDEVAVQFNLSTGQQSVEVARITLHSSWQGYLNQQNGDNLNDDIAILELKDRRPDGATPFEIDLSGLTEPTRIVLAGYGRRGDGLVGYYEVDDQTNTGPGASNLSTRVVGWNLASGRYADDDGSVTDEVWIADFDNPLDPNNVYDTLEDGHALESISVFGLDLAEAGIGKGDSGGGAFTFDDVNTNDRLDEGETLRWWGNLTADNPVPSSALPPGFYADKNFPKYGSWSGGMIGAAYADFIQVNTMRFGEPEFYATNDGSATRIPIATSVGGDFLTLEDLRIQYADGNTVVEISLAGATLNQQEPGNYLLDLGTLTEAPGTYTLLPPAISAIEKERGPIHQRTWTQGTWRQIGVDIDGENAGDRSGESVSLSADGATVAIGARINNGNGDFSGHVRVYRFGSGSWQQLGQDIDGENAGDSSGWSLSISADGTTVAIGAPQNDDNGDSSGHVRVYRIVSGEWTKLGQDLDGESDGDESGWSVSLSADGSTVAVGAPLNDVHGLRTGHVRVYQFVSGAWTQLGVDIDGEGVGDSFGSSVSLSSDGSTVAIGAPENVSNSLSSGYVEVFQFVSGTWTQVGPDIDGEHPDDRFGWAVSLSSDGSTVAIGAPNNDGNGVTSGQVQVYQFEAGTWTQLGVDIDGENVQDYSGSSISLSSDGTTVAVAARCNAAYSFDPTCTRVYQYASGAWTQLGQTINDVSSAGPPVVSLSSDAKTVAIGQGNGSISGHVRVFTIALANSSVDQSLPNAPVILTPVTSTVNNTPFISWTAEEHAVYYELEVRNSVGNVFVSNESFQQASYSLSLAINGVYSVRVRGLTTDREPGPWSAKHVFEIDLLAEEQVSPLRQMYALAMPAYNGDGDDITVVAEALSNNQSFTVSAGYWDDGALKFASLGSFTHAGTGTRAEVEVDLSDADVSLLETSVVIVSSDGPVAIVAADSRYTDVTDIAGTTVVTPAVATLPTVDLPSIGDTKLYRWNWSASPMRYELISDLSSIDWNRDTRILTHGWDDGLGASIDAEYMVKYAHSLKQLDSNYENVNVIAIDWSAGANPDGADTIDVALSKTAIAAAFGAVKGGVAGAVKDAGLAVIDEALVALRDAELSAQNGIQIGRGVATLLESAWSAPGKVPTTLTLVGHSNGGGLVASLAVTLLQTEVGKSVPDVKLVALDTPVPRLTSAGTALRNAARLLADVKIANYYIQMGGFIGGAGMDDVANYDLETTTSFLFDHGEIANRFADNEDWMALGTHLHAFEVAGVGKPWIEVRADGSFTRAQKEDIADVNDAARNWSTAAWNGIADGATTFWDLVTSTASVTRDAIVSSTKAFNATLVFPPSSLQTHPLIRGKAQSPVNIEVEVAIPADASLLVFNFAVSNPGNNDILYVMAGDEILGEFDLATIADYGLSTLDVSVGDFAGTAQTIRFFMPSDESSDAEFVISNIEFLSFENETTDLVARVVKLDSPETTLNDWFGYAMANIGDLDGDGIEDLAVGAPRDAVGGERRGAVQILFMNDDGSVRATSKIGHETGGGPTLVANAWFGRVVAALGDLNNDGIADIAASELGPDGIGKIHVLFLNANGTAKARNVLTDEIAGNAYGSSMASLGDVNGDGNADMVVGVSGADGGRGVVELLFLNSDGSVLDSFPITSEANGGPALDDAASFGFSVTRLGDIDQNGSVDFAVGAPGTDEGRGSVYIVRMNGDGSVLATNKIGPFIDGTLTLDEYSNFGISVTTLDDRDGNGVRELAVGAPSADGATGLIYILYLMSDGQVLKAEAIGSGVNGVPNLAEGSEFGISLATLPDLDGNGFGELVAGAVDEDGDDSDPLAVRNGFVLYLRPDVDPDEVQLKWHNATTPTDVNGDDTTSPLDALVIINDLNSHGARILSRSPSVGARPGFLDVNGDGSVSPVDVLIIINRLNQTFISSEAEGVGALADDAMSAARSDSLIRDETFVDLLRFAHGSGVARNAESSRCESGKSVRHRVECDEELEAALEAFVDDVAETLASLVA